MNKLGKKLAAVSLCACFAASALTGCTTDKENKAVITVDDDTVSYGLVNFTLRYNQAQMQSYYGAFMGADMWTNYGDTTKDNIVESLENMLLLEQHAEEYGISLSDEEKEQISEAAQAFVDSNEEKVLEAMSGTIQNVERFLTLYTIQNKMYDAIIAEADTNVTDEEAAQKTVQYVLFSTSGSVDENGDTVEMTDEEKEEKKSQAESLLEAVKGGEDMAEALKEIDEDRSPTTSSYGEDNGYLADAVKEVADTLSDGEVADELVETDGGYYVVQMVTTFDEEKTEERKETIISERQSEHYTEVLEGWKEEAAISTDSDLLASLTFDDTFELKLDETESEALTEAVNETEEETTEAADSEEASEEETTEAADSEEASEEETTEAVTTEETSEEETTEEASEEETTEAVAETTEAETTEE